MLLMKNKLSSAQSKLREAQMSYDGLLLKKSSFLAYLKCSLHFYLDIYILIQPEKLYHFVKFLGQKYGINLPSNTFFQCLLKNWPKAQTIILVPKQKNKTRGLQLYQVFHFTTQWISILDVAKIWPLYCQNMVLTWSFKWVLPES